MKHLDLNPDPQHQPCLYSHVPSGALLGIRIRMLLGLPDPYPDPLVTGTDLDPDPSISKQK